MLSHSSGLYDPWREHDACGIGAAARISGREDHSILEMARDVLMNMQHRGAKGGEESTGDGAGILIQIPDEFFAAEADRLGFTLPPAGHYDVALRGLLSPGAAARHDEDTIAPRLRAFGYTQEDLDRIVEPMALTSQEPVGSMGTRSWCSRGN